MFTARGSAQAFAVLLCFSSYSFGQETLSRDQIAQIQTAADHGNSDSQAQLSGLYRFGSGVKQDLSKAFMWAQKAADQGHAQAQHYVGICYTYEMGAEKNLGKAFEWFKKSAEQHFIAAQYRVGYCYLNGEGVPVNYEEGIQWLTLSADRGDADSQLLLGKFYQNVASKEEKSELSFDGGAAARTVSYMWYNLAAGRGNEEAGELRDELASGMSLTEIEAAQKMSADWKVKTLPIEAEALEPLKSRATNGDASAQFVLARRYSTGQGLPKDDAEALRWAKKAAEQGLVEAQLQLGFSYGTGKGFALSKDESEAFRWFKKAADQGNDQGQAAVGINYIRGSGVAKDENEGCQWLRKAIEQENRAAFDWAREAANDGIGDAQFLMGICYAKGSIIAKDEDESKKWFRKAAASGSPEMVKLTTEKAESGDASSQSLLGYWYFAGQGVPKDSKKAFIWFSLAAANGQQSADAMISAIRKDLTADEVEECENQIKARKSSIER